MLDACQHELGELDRREFTLAEKVSDLFDWGRTPDRYRSCSEYSLLMAQIPEGTDVGDDERDAELILPRAPARD